MIPQYLTTDQVRPLLEAAQGQGIDPGTALKALTDQGHIVQGVNDQQYQFSQNQPIPGQDQGQPQSQDSGDIIGKVGSFLGDVGTGIVKGAQREISAIGNPIANAASQGLAKLGIGHADANFNQQYDQQQAQEQAPTNTAQKIGGGIENVASTVGFGLAGEGLAADAAKAAGLTGKAITAAKAVGSGLGVGVHAFGTTDGSLQERTNQGIGQGAFATLASFALPMLGIGGSSTSEAVSTARDTMVSAAAERATVGQELINGAAKLTAENPEAIAQFNTQEGVKIISALDEVGANTAPLADGLTPAGVQEFSSNLNRLASMSSDRTAIKLFETNNAFREYAQQALNETKPGVGDALEGLYSKASSDYETLKSVGDIFKPNANPTASEINKLIRDVRSMTPEEKIAFQQNAEKLLESRGIDLTDPVKQMAYVNKLKPRALKAIGTLGKAGLGLFGLHELNNLIH